MKRIWLVVPALTLCLAGTIGTASAEDAAAKTEKKERREKNGRKAGMPQRLKERYEAIAGKPLTPEQEKAIIEQETAHKTAMQELRAKHNAKIAATLGVTVEQMEAAEMASRKKMMEERKDKAPVVVPAPAPAVQ